MDKMVIWNFLVDAWFFAIPIVLPLLFGWAMLKVKDMVYSAEVSSNIKSLINVGMLAVEATEQEYVKQIKIGREDGKLTQEERNLAFSMAVNKFKSLVWNQLGERVANNISDSDTKTFVEAGLKTLKARL
jgi:hypothetical protein